MIMKLMRRVRGEFVILIEVCLYLIECNPGHALLGRGGKRVDAAKEVCRFVERSANDDLELYFS